MIVDELWSDGRGEAFCPKIVDISKQRNQIWKFASEAERPSMGLQSGFLPAPHQEGR